jgi:hypothetical protein
MVSRLAIVLVAAMISCSKTTEHSIVEAVENLNTETVAGAPPTELQSAEVPKVTLSFVRAMDHGYTTISNPKPGRPATTWNGWSAIMKLDNPTDKSISFHAQGLANPMVHSRSWRGEVFTDDPERDCYNGFHWYSLLPGESTLFDARMNEDDLPYQLRLDAWLTEDAETAVTLWSDTFRFEHEENL